MAPQPLEVPMKLQPPLFPPIRWSSQRKTNNTKKG